MGAVTTFRELTLSQNGTAKAVFATLSGREDAAYLVQLGVETTARATIVVSGGEGVSRSPVVVDVPRGGTFVAVMGRVVEVSVQDTGNAAQTVTVAVMRLDTWIVTRNYVTETVYISSFTAEPCPTPPAWAKTVRVEAASGVSADINLLNAAGTPVASASTGDEAIVMVGIAAAEVVGPTGAYVRVVYELAL